MKCMSPAAILVAGLLCLGAVPAAMAALGETPEQIEARYGKPQSTTERHPVAGFSGVYVHGPYQVTVVFFQGVSQHELYVRPDNPALTLAELADLLKANARGQEWKETKREGEPEVRIWLTDDAEARSPEGDLGLLVQTNAFMAFWKEWTDRPFKMKGSFDALLPGRSVKGALMMLVAPPRLQEATARMMEAVKRNQEWFMKAAQEKGGAAPMPYDERLGISREEYAEYLGLLEQGATLTQILVLELDPVQTKDGACCYLKAGPDLPWLREIWFDSIYDCIYTPYGTLKAPKEREVAAPGGALGPWKGLEYVLQEGTPESIALGVAGKLVALTIGKRTDTGRRFLMYKVMVAEKGVHKVGYEFVVIYE